MRTDLAMLYFHQMIQKRTVYIQHELVIQHSVFAYSEAKR